MSRKPKHDQAWFQGKVRDLGEELKRLPDDRQLLLFNDLLEPKDPPRDRKREGREEA